MMGLPAARRFSAARIAGACLLALWALLGAAVFWSLATGFEDYRPHVGKFVRGLGVTIFLVALSLAIGAVLSFPLALARLSGSRLARAAAFAYSSFFRGTPLIAQTFLVYYGFGSFREFLEDAHLWPLFRDPLNCAVLVFSLNTAAYQAEILQGAIRNVAAGQREAGRSLGMGRAAIFLRVVLPQALIVCLRPYGNEVILLLKGSAIASIITVYDLMGETRLAFSRTFDYNTYLLAALMYLLLVEAIRRLWERAEGRMTRHLRR